MAISNDRAIQNITRSVALVGNPNCGKTTVFNALTGSCQRVGNWPGVTVERKSGHFIEAEQTIEVIDLPGTYAINQLGETGGLDECIACEFILLNKADVIVNIVDASNLERHLYLTTQLLEMGAPLIVALNMMDVARDRKIHVDVAKLSKQLGCPIVALEARNGCGIKQLKKAIAEQSVCYVQQRILYAEELQHVIEDLAKHLPSPEKSIWLALRLLEDDAFARRQVSPAVLAQVEQYQKDIQQTLGEEADILLADARYRFIERLLKTCIRQDAEVKPSWTTWIDHLVLNRFLGVPIFLGIMYLLFFFSINVGGAFQDFFDMSSETIFVNGLAYLLNQIHAPIWLTALLADGVGKGINTTITFIPVIGAMFLFLAFLEDSGYMARAAFIIDRLMRALSLPGKAFVPMIVGFGCNVPAVMAARTLENKRDRILTIMMSPFMSCGARLAIYAIFTAAFFPRSGQNIVFALYIMGILMAMFTGFILRQTVLQGEPSPLVMELPPYHMPRFRSLVAHAWQRLKSFVFRAGKLIVPICVLIGALNALNIDGTIGTGDADSRSLLSLVGQWVTPIFSPMGIHADNWPATVGLVTGILAKEVVVGTLNTLYTQMGHFAIASADVYSFWGGLNQALHSIPDNFSQLITAISNPVLAKAPINTVNQDVYGMMYQKFDGQVGAFAYLLFVLLYFPCISTTAVMLRELHRGWSVFSICWMTGVAYATAVIFYQAATWQHHPYSSLAWIISLTAIFALTVLGIRWFAKHGITGSNKALFGATT